jgi:hypothetical protein
MGREIARESWSLGGVCLARWQVVKMFFGTGFEENGEGIRGPVR